MMIEPTSTARTYGIRGPNTWAVIRNCYLAGEGAPSLGERYAVSESAIRTRARKEGWRKRDVPDLAPPPDAGVLATAPSADDRATPTDLSEAARRAAHAATEALGVGRLKLAIEYARVAEALSRVRMRLDGPAGPDPDRPELDADDDVLASLAQRLAELKAEEGR